MFNTLKTIGYVALAILVAIVIFSIGVGLMVVLQMIKLLVIATLIIAFITWILYAVWTEHK